MTFGIPGQADLTGITHDGRRLEIECKSATGRQSEAQRMFAAIIERMNGIYILVRSGSDAEEQLASRGYPRKA